MDLFSIIYLIIFFFGFFFMFIFIILHLKYNKDLNSFIEPSEYKTITFLVPAYNEQDSIENTVKSLTNLEYPKDKLNILIINDGSKDKTLEVSKILSQKYSNVSILDKLNSGKANSLNEAIKKIDTELFAVVDADSYPDKNSVKRMIGHFEEEGVEAVTSRVLVKNKNNLLEKFQVLDYSIIAWTRKLLDFVDSVYVTNGPLSIYKTQTVKKLGGFDPNNLTEDIELTWNILSNGYKTRMSYSSIVYTTVPNNLKQWINQRIRWNLGGLQTVQKYRKSLFKNKKNLFGYFVLPYVASSFMLAVIGILLFLRYFWIKGSYYLLSLSYFREGYYFFNYFDFNWNISLILFFALIFIFLSIYYYKIGFKNSETGNKSILKILSYSMLYRTLYVVPLIGAIYKLVRGDINWYTK